MKPDPKLALGWKERMKMSPEQKKQYRRIYQMLRQRLRRGEAKL